MSDDVTHVRIGDDPDKVGPCEAAIFVVELRGRKARGRIMLRREFASGREAMEFCKPEEERLSALYKAPAGTIYNDPGLSQFELERRVNEMAKAAVGD